MALCEHPYLFVAGGGFIQQHGNHFPLASSTQVWVMGETRSYMSSVDHLSLSHINDTIHSTQLAGTQHIQHHFIIMKILCGRVCCLDFFWVNRYKTEVMLSYFQHSSILVSHPPAFRMAVLVVTLRKHMNMEKRWNTSVISDLQWLDQSWLSVWMDSGHLYHSAKVNYN